MKVTETGLDALSRRWKESPPEEELTSLEACAREFRRLFPDAIDRDPVASFTADAPTWQEATHRACRSKDANGKHHNHQSRVPMPVLMEFAKRIRRRIREIVNSEAADMAGWTPHDWSFDGLHDELEDIAAGMSGIGPVTTYDVAWRLACWLGIEVESLYLHAGVRKGAAAVGLPTRRVKRIERETLEDYLGAEVLETLGDINGLEDFLCCFRRVFPTLPDAAARDRIDWAN